MRKGFLSLHLPVNVDGFQETEGNPGPQKHHVVTEDHDTDEEASSQDQSLGWVCILGLHAERRLEDTTYSIMEVTNCTLFVCALFVLLGFVVQYICVYLCVLYVFMGASAYDCMLV